MADNAPSWSELATAFLTHPEKGALLLVLVAGAWRWIRELWRESKEDLSHESLVELLMKENRELRNELRTERQEHRHDQQNSVHHRDSGGSGPDRL